VKAVNANKAWLWDPVTGISLWDRGSFRGVSEKWLQVCDVEVEGEDTIIYTTNHRSVHRMNSNGVVTGFDGITAQMLARDKEGRIYAAGWEGLYVLDDMKWTKIGDEACWQKVCLYPDGMSALAALSEGVVWAAGLGGLLKWTPDKCVILREVAGVHLAPGEEEYEGTMVRCRVAGLAGLSTERILVGLWQHGLLSGDVPDFKLVKTNLGPPSRMSALCEDTDGRLWCGGMDGLALLQGGQWRDSHKVDSLQAGPIALIGLDAVGRVWLAQNRQICIWGGSDFQAEDVSRTGCRIRGRSVSRPRPGARCGSLWTLTFRAGRDRLKGGVALRA